MSRFVVVLLLFRNVVVRGEARKRVEHRRVEERLVRVAQQRLPQRSGAGGGRVVGGEEDELEVVRRVRAVEWRRNDDDNVVAVPAISRPPSQACSHSTGGAHTALEKSDSKS
jgi:hypothetical protein